LRGFIYDERSNVYALQDAAQAWKDIAGTARGARDVAQRAANGKTQVTR
jgi:hypothetical protein